MKSIYEVISVNAETLANSHFESDDEDAAKMVFELLVNKGTEGFVSLKEFGQIIGWNSREEVEK